MKHEKTSKEFFVSQKSQSDFLGPKTLTTIVASVILAAAVPLITGCIEKVNTYALDSNGNYKVVDTHHKLSLSSKVNIPPLRYKKNTNYDPNSQ